MGNKLFISQIQRYSMHDGPGIRTTYFLKGCNLRCQWCHNPETQHRYREIQYMEKRCRGCGVCLNVCPEKAISIKNNRWHLDLGKCAACGVCVENCYADALQMSGRYVDIQDTLDDAYYDDLIFGCGGITLSGGEPMLQIEEVSEMLKMAKEKGIHTAVDTAGCVSWSNFEKIIPYTDLFLFDVKAVRNHIHKEYIGVANRLILENLKRLSWTGKTEIWIRMPLIHQVNDSDEDISAFMAYYRELGKIERIDLLTYHSYGLYKAQSLQMQAKVFQEPDAGRMQKIKEMIQSVNKNVVIS